MKPNWTKFVLSVAVIGLCGFGIVEWQISRLSKGLRSMPVVPPLDLTVGAASDLVLDKSVLPQNVNSDGLAAVDQYLKDPKGFKQREHFVRTWVSASSLAEALFSQRIPADRTISATTLQVPPEERVDAWSNPFCVFSDGVQIVVMSSGGNGKLDCESLRDVARRLARTSSTKKLIRDQTGIYSVVHKIIAVNE